ncbi:MAG: phage portal protein family protein [Rhodobacterales bacterium]
MKVTNDKLGKSKRKNLSAQSGTLVATARNDITIPYFSTVLQPLDDTLLQRGGGKGLKLYDEIERDTHAFAMLQKRKKTLLAREWEVNPASDAPRDVEAAEVVRDCLKALPFDRICEDLLDATLKGFAICEVVWGREGNRIMPIDVVAHDQRRFVFGHDWRPRLLTHTNVMLGEELPDRKFIVHRHGVKGNNPYGLGLGTRLFWPVFFKRENIAFWLYFLEKFAGPTAIAYSPYTNDPAEQRRMINTLNDIRTASSVVMPLGSDVKFLEAARSGSVSYQEFLTYWDKQISICVTGETLTTDIGTSGSKAASQTHADMLENLVDSDGDLLSDSLREQLLTWIVDYNVPGAAVPSVWRTRTENETEAATTRKAKAEAAMAGDAALAKIVATASRLEQDDDAREYITSFGLTDGLSDGTIDRLVASRFKVSAPSETSADPAPQFADPSDPLKKKDLTHVCLADENGPVAQITNQLMALSQGHFTRRLKAIRTAVDIADPAQAMRNLLALAARWTPDAQARLLGQAMELAAWEGRGAVFQDADAAGFATEVSAQPFLEQIDFLRQKRIAPSKTWTDTLRGDHDRKFVVAGATDLALVEDFKNAVARAIDTWDEKAFAKDFDAIVEKHGWSYNGGRDWRIRTIFATNIATSHMAGRLRQMRDPDVIRLRPYWQYRHGENGTPLNPRPQHLAWDGRILMHDDVWWETHFPPNDWACSCGVRTLSKGDLKRLGKDGPDRSPEIIMEPILDKVTGLPSEKPKGVGYGWDYQPGDKWERGLVPSALIEEAGGLSLTHPKLAVEIDTPQPLADLLASPIPFTSKPMKEGLSEEDYVRGFLQPFGADIGRAVLFEDKAGGRIPISDALFRNARGDWKVGKRERATLTPLLAEAIMDPDEIWLGVARRPDKVDRDQEELIVDRRYIRTDGASGLLIVYQIGQWFWDAITAFNPTKKNGNPDLLALDKRRSGKLLWKRPKD